MGVFNQGKNVSSYLRITSFYLPTFRFVFDFELFHTKVGERLLNFRAFTYLQTYIHIVDIKFFKVHVQETRELNNSSPKQYFDCTHFLKHAWIIFDDNHKFLYNEIAVPSVKFCKFQTKFLEIFHVA